ncbi:hypothetical protein HRbin19_01033 [bacterium HR19]|nr:hypothetical protein HRbin19_01033 [bacterium HR19]
MEDYSVGITGEVEIEFFFSACKNVITQTKFDGRINSQSSSFDTSFSAYFKNFIIKVVQTGWGEEYQRS